METVFFAVWQEDFSDKALAGEFGKLLLRSRESWRRVMEPLLVFALWYCAAYLLVLALTPVGERIFLVSEAVMVIGLSISLLTAAAALWATVYLLFFRAAAIGRKRLRRIQGDWAEYRFLADKLVSISEKGQAEIPYDLDMWEECHVGKTACYLKIKGIALYVIIQKKYVTFGNFEDFPAFIQEKTGLSVRTIK